MILLDHYFIILVLSILHYAYHHPIHTITVHHKYDTLIVLKHIHTYYTYEYTYTYIYIYIHTYYTTYYLTPFLSFNFWTTNMS